MTDKNDYTLRRDKSRFCTSMAGCGARRKIRRNALHCKDFATQQRARHTL